MFPISSVCFATLGQKKGDLAEAKSALIDEVELMIAEAQAAAAKSMSRSTCREQTGGGNEGRTNAD